MSRKIIDKLFQNQKALPPEENQFVSMKDWKAMVSRLESVQAQVGSCNEKISFMYSKVMRWLNQVREKTDKISKIQKEMDSATKNMFKEWEKKLVNFVQPEQRKEDQKRVMDLMRRHSQFIQSYSKQINSIQSALSKNEYQVYQLLEQMRSVRVEIDLINREKRTKKKFPSFTLQEEEASLYSDLFS